MQSNRPLNWIGAVVSITAAIAALGVDHLAVLNLSPTLLPVVQATLLLVVAVTGWMQKKYALPDDQRLAKLIAAVPPDALDQILTIVQGVKQQKVQQQAQVAANAKQREARRIIAEAQAKADALLKGNGSADDSAQNTDTPEQGA